jgi:hypothetical protein
VRRTYPRPPRDGEEIAKAIGRAIDGTLSEIGHRARSGRRATVSAARAFAARALDEEIAAAGEALTPGLRAAVDEEIEGVIRAFRVSPLYGLPRPRSRVILIGGRSGIYAQPDYWDGVRRFYEMKSYRALPMPPDVALQLRLFQLAFPRLEAVVYCIDRHARPVASSAAVVPPPTSAESAEALRRADDLAREFGERKVLEYVEGPFVAYDRPPPKPTAP